MNKLIKKAFTLIELLVVIAIIGILSSLIVVSMGGIATKANIAKSQVFSNSIRNSLMINMVGEWEFDGTATDGTTATNADVVDTWGGVNNGSVTVPARTHTPIVKTGSNCINGSCLQFDGTADYVSCGAGVSLNLVNAITITAWIYPVEDKLEAIVMDQVGGGGTGGVPVEFYRQVGGQLRFVSYYNSIPGTITHAQGGNIPLNVWSFVTATFDKNLTIGAGKVYINGLQVGTGNDQTPLPILEGFRSIGSYGGGGWYFNGKIDDVRIYNAAILASQIKEQYYVGLNNLLISNKITKEEYNSKISQLAINK